MAGAVFMLAPPASATQHITQSYTCSPGGAASITIVGTATETETNETISLTGVKFTVTNSFGVTITAKNIQVNVPDPNNTSAPYIAGSAAVATTPPGWTAGHGTGGIFALHAGNITLANGATLSNAALRAKYKDKGPVGTVIKWVGGTVTLQVISPIVASVTCTPNAPLMTVTSVTE
jgi:hypothetical protein